MARTPKGEIAIEDFRGWVRLRWRHQGQRVSLSLGLRYDPVNLAIAQTRATQIRLDLLSGNYDPSLAKYRSDRPAATAAAAVAMGAVELFTQFTEWRSKQLQARTVEKYQVILTWLKDEFGDRPVTREAAESFLGRMLASLQPTTVRDRVAVLNAAWKWAEAQGMVEGNPWSDLKVKSPPKQAPKPFTKAEVAAIVAGFEADSYYRHYADYCRFKFGTGCRTGEASGLRWRHITADCSIVWFGESYTHGQFKDTKTGKAREVKLSPSITAMLRARIPKDVEPDRLVFTTPLGKPIDDRRFSRAWGIILKAQGIPYRTPYNTRHTFISHALEAGISPVEVAAITGHNVKVLFEHYAGLIKSHPTTPELF